MEQKYARKLIAPSLFVRQLRPIIDDQAQLVKIKTNEKTTRKTSLFAIAANLFGFRKQSKTNSGNLEMNKNET